MTCKECWWYGKPIECPADFNLDTHECKNFKPSLVQQKITAELFKIVDLENGKAVKKMRDILFRGKAIGGLNACRWIYGYYVKDFWAPSSVGYGIIPADRDIGGYCKVYPDTVGQYTGLKDKNGTMIFEGDIVKLYFFDGCEEGVIKFNNIMCRFMFFTIDGSYGFDKDCIFEIIGNIHDNPELLKGGAE